MAIVVVNKVNSTCSLCCFILTQRRSQQTLGGILTPAQISSFRHTTTVSSLTNLLPHEHLGPYLLCRFFCHVSDSLHMSLYVCCGVCLHVSVCLYGCQWVDMQQQSTHWHLTGIVGLNTGTAPLSAITADRHTGCK
jgi:hypothetical protein